MFTIKFYSDNGHRQKILSAESFTILRGTQSPSGDEAEITLHQKNPNDDVRYDIKFDAPQEVGYSGPIRYQRAIIENAAGKTTEIIQLQTSNALPQ
jgi:hypothetical protein